MLLVVTAGDGQWEELVSSSPENEWLRVIGAADFASHPNADAFFNLHADAAAFDYAGINKPVFINAVIQTLKSINAPAHVLRINGWPGFLKRPVWEIAGITNDHLNMVLEQAGKKMICVADEPGLVAARVISMIINEAYFAMADQVSTTAEIDIAMKLGTNYPLGPFEWASLIGHKNIAGLLQKLGETESRYQPAPLLLKAAAEDHQ